MSDRFDAPGTPGTPGAPTPPAGLPFDSDSRLDPAVVTVWRLAGTVTAAVVGGATLIGATAWILATRPERLTAGLLLGGWLTLALGLLALVLVWPPLRYRHVGYRVDARGLRIRRGVLWRSDHSIPRSRIQHTDVAQGPLERAFGLATLIVHTAGTENASIGLGGLTRATADAIRDHLIDVGGDDAV